MRLPRPVALWLSAAPLAAALVALAYPAGPAALLADLRHADADRHAERTEADRLAALRRAQADRYAARQAVTADVLAGHADLADAVRRFTDIHADDPAARDALAVRFGPRPDDELAARSVLSHADLRAGEAAPGVLARLRSEFRQRFGGSTLDEPPAVDATSAGGRP